MLWQLTARNGPKAPQSSLTWLSARSSGTCIILHMFSQHCHFCSHCQRCHSNPYHGRKTDRNTKPLLPEMQQCISAQVPHTARISLQISSTACLKLRPSATRLTSAKSSPVLLHPASSSSLHCMRRAPICAASRYCSGTAPGCSTNLQAHQDCFRVVQLPSAQRAGYLWAEAAICASRCGPSQRHAL